jgi:phosphatidylglycerophosphate synthase
LLAAGALVVGLLTVATARRPTEPLPSLDGYFARWKVQHHAPDVEPGEMAFVRQTLAIAYRASKPLARFGAQPDVLTLWGLWLAGAVVVAAQAGGRWSLAAAAITVASAMTDAIDGCVAALTDRATRFGYVLDSVADRIADVALLVALVAVGGRAEAAAAAGAALGLLEYTRARAGNAGLGEVAVVTVGERPTRVVVTVFSLVGAGLHVSRAADFGVFGLVVTAAVSAVGLVQLLVVVHRRLR